MTPPPDSVRHVAFRYRTRYTQVVLAEYTESPAKSAAPISPSCTARGIGSWPGPESEIFESTTCSHSFASGGLLVGEGLPMIGKLLGHNKVQTTARYAHLANDPVKSVANRIASRIAEVVG